MNLLVQRMEDHIYQMSKFSSTPGNGVSRIVYSKEDVSAKNYLITEMQKLSLKVTEDEIGNIFAVWEGKYKEINQVWTGSHTDAPINGGKYDGVVGVLSAIEAIRILQNNGFKPDYDIVVVIFVAEEPTRFGVGCLGSRALTGMIADDDFHRWHDKNNQTLQEVLVLLNKNPNKIMEEVINSKKVRAFLEIHIEQGPVLEKEKKPIGIVDVISAATEISLSIYGEQRHAGSTPMNMRKDPVPAASEVTLLIEKIVPKISKTAVGTVGYMKAYPGTSNVIADHVEISIDIRDTNKHKKDQIVYSLKNEVELLVRKRGLNYTWKIGADDDPAYMDKENIALIKSCALELGLPYQQMHSGAYHDALIMASKVPSNLIFIPSNTGIGHAPDEFTSTFHIAKGVELLAQCLKKLTKSYEVLK